MTGTHNGHPGALSSGSRNTDDSGLELWRLRLTNMDIALPDILFCFGGFWCVHVIYAFAHVCVCLCVHLGTCTCGSQKLTTDVLFSCLPHYFVRQGPLLNPELTDLSGWLANRPQAFLSLLALCCAHKPHPTCHAFSVDSGYGNKFLRFM